MSVWVFLLGFVSVLIVTYIVKAQMRQNIEKQITEEMNSIQSNCELYVRQILLINSASISETGFEQCAYEIEQQLKRAGYTDIALYTMDGRLLRSSKLQRFSGENSRKDFQFARKLRSAFSLRYKKQS